MTAPHFFSFTLLFQIFCIAAATASSNECVYSLYVQTGSFLKAGTDSNICLSFGDSTGNSVRISNLTTWGIMGRRHDYFERANLDIFTGRGPCIGAPICRLNVTSDGSGAHHGWYCDSIQITSTGPHKGCAQSIFHVDQWLAINVAPYQLSAAIDGCRNYAGRRDHTGTYVVPRTIEHGSE